MTRVLLTRPTGQAGELAARLSEHGIGSIHVPTVAVVPAADGRPLARALQALATGGWLVVTSAPGAAAVVGALAGRQLATGVQVAAVGSATAAALQAHGIGVDLVPDRFLAEAIPAAMGDLRDRVVLLARADAADGALPATLRERGARVEEMVAYRTVEGPPGSRARIRRVLADGVDGILLTSGSSARGLVALLSARLRDRARTLPAFCIGPVTASAAREMGFTVGAVARDHTAAGLAAATASYFSKEAP
ncbi:MAG: uroporphyrinogen-III synthase [Candidatus Limnocylindria bacterium]